MTFQLDAPSNVIRILPMEHTITHSTVAPYILGGHGMLTVESPKTGARFTFKCHRPGKPQTPGKPPVPVFVSVLTGPDNTSDYQYLGAIFQDRDFVITKKSKISTSAPSAVAFRWLWERALTGSLPPSVRVMHHGRCGLCGRVLTVPESIETGIGPVCAAK